jgi:DNA-binding Lrp family transcriptional regulator
MNQVLQSHLLNDYQRNFPLESKPFATIAKHLGVGEGEVLQTLNNLQQAGVISRVGAVFRPRSIGFSSLAALSVADERLEEVAQIVNSYPEVNHNYQREHHYNLWFVVASATEKDLHRVLQEIEARSGCKVLFLPLMEDYHIDLGFDMTGSRNKRAAFLENHAGMPDAPYVPGEQENALIAAIQSGLPLVERPFSAVGEAMGQSEVEVINSIERLTKLGVIKRIGVVVRHHELGYRANAMVVWDIPDEDIKRQGFSLGQLDCVTLCYRRPRRLPEWRYNLFCMIHGRDREEVLAHVDQMREENGLRDAASEVLFSIRRFKQCGAQYARTAA